METMLPRPLEKNAIKLNSFIDELMVYRKTDEPFQRFITREVSVIGAYNPEKAMPTSSLDTVFIGSWERHPISGLYARFGMKGDSVVLARQYQDSNRWFLGFIAAQMDLCLITAANLNYDEIKDMSEYAAEFRAVMNTYFRV